MAENINLDPPVFLSKEEIPAKDPRNKHYLKVCFVCQEEAKPDKVSIKTIFLILYLKAR